MRENYKRGKTSNGFVDEDKTKQEVGHKATERRNKRGQERARRGRARQGLT